MRRGNGVLLGIAAALVAVGVTPASASQQTGSANAIRRSVTRTVQQGSARIAADVELKSASTNGHITFDGVADFAGKQMSLTADLSQLAKQPTTFEMRMVDGLVYLDLGSVLRAAHKTLPAELANLEWVKMDLSQLGANTGVSTGAPTLGSDASSQLQALQGVTNGSVQQVGPDSIRGVPTTHYRAAVDLGLALKRLPSSLQTRLRNATRLFANSDHLPIDVWIDSTGLVRRYGINVTINPPHGSSVEEGMTFDFYDFGVPVVVQAPPPDQVTDFSALQRILTSATNPSA